MADRDRLEALRPAAEEAFAGLTADERLRLSILRSAEEPTKRRMPAGRLVPALAAVAVLVGVVAVGTGRLQRAAKPLTASEPQAKITSAADMANAVDKDIAEETALMEAESAPIVAMTEEAEWDDDAFVMETEEDAAWDALTDLRAGAGDAQTEAMPEGTMVAALGASLGTASARVGSLFAEGSPEVPLVAVNGAVYRLLTEPAALTEALLGDAVGAVRQTTDTPSLADATALAAGLSNCCAAGAEIRRVASLPQGTAVACQVDGRWRLFQRVSYAGLSRAPGLSESLAIGGQVKEIRLGGRSLTGEAAQEAVSLLLSSATLAAQDAEPEGEEIVFTLQNGLKLAMALSGDRLVACGAWRCEAFLRLFED